MPAESPTDLCIRCGYDLSGLGAESLCPECALPAAVSRERSPLLRGADREWLRGVAGGLRGIDRAMWAILGVLVGSIAITLLAVVIEVALRVDVRGGAWIAAAWLAGLAAAAALHIMGCWRLTVATPSEYAPPVRARLVLRASGVALPVAAALVVLPHRLFPPMAPPARMGAVIGAQAIGVAFGLSLGRVMEHLERRTPGWSPALSRKHRNFRKNIWGVAVILVLFDLGARGRDVEGLTQAVMGLMYMSMDSAVARVRRAAAGELADAGAGPEPDRYPAPP
jgi:hypothetical protein